jgi:hypothetical protein
VPTCCPRSPLLSVAYERAQTTVDVPEILTYPTA